MAEVAPPIELEAAAGPEPALPLAAAPTAPPTDTVVEEARYAAAKAFGASDSAAAAFATSSNSSESTTKDAAEGSQVFASLRASCDRCYERKLRCVLNKETGVCEACANSKHVCVRSKEKKRGRPRLTDEQRADACRQRVENSRKPLAWRPMATIGGDGMSAAVSQPQVPPSLAPPPFPGLMYDAQRGGYVYVNPYLLPPRRRAPQGILATPPATRSPPSTPLPCSRSPAPGGRTPLNRTWPRRIPRRRRPSTGR